MKKLLPLLLACLFYAGANAQTCAWYASPAGLPTNAGTRQSPVDLQTALNLPPSPACVVNMLGGTYVGTFMSNLRGTAGNPITLRSAPGEWAVIDGNYRLTLANSIDTGWGGTVYFAEYSNLPDIFNALIDGEVMQFWGRQNGGYRINDRGRDGTQITTHSPGSQAVIRMPAFDTAGSADAIYRDFEITNSLPQRTVATPGSGAVDPDYRLASIIFTAPRSKLINLIIRDGGDTAFWSSAVDSEIYGCIIYNGGHDAPDGGHGAGIYTQNETGRKEISDNIIFGNFNNLAIQLYGSSASTLRGYLIDGNISLDRRWLMGGNAPADDLTISNNFLYRMGMELGYGNPFNGSAVVRNNYIYGGTLDIKYWQRITSTGNKLYSQWPVGALPMSIRFQNSENNLANYAFSNNDYINGNSFDSNQPFRVATDAFGANYYSFAQWQARGFDLNSTLLWENLLDGSYSRPRGQSIFYRPNKYEAGRGNIIVYSYENAASFNVDPSQVGLQIGQRFEIRNGLNYKAAPIYTGTYNGQPVNVQFSSLQIAQPFGIASRTNEQASPGFAVVTVVPLAAALPAANVSVGGRVFGLDGVSGAPGTVIQCSCGLSAMADAAGYYTIQNVPPGTWVFRETRYAPHFDPQTVTVTAAITNLNFYAHPAN